MEVEPNSTKCSVDIPLESRKRDICCRRNKTGLVGDRSSYLGLRNLHLGYSKIAMASSGGISQFSEVALWGT